MCKFGKEEFFVCSSSFHLSCNLDRHEHSLTDIMLVFHKFILSCLPLMGILPNIVPVLDKIYLSSINRLERKIFSAVKKKGHFLHIPRHLNRAPSPQMLRFSFPLGRCSTRIHTLHVFIFAVGEVRFSLMARKAYISVRPC